MKMILFTNITPVTNAYTNFNHLYLLKRLNPKKVYLCVWDNFTFEHKVFQKNLGSTTNQKQKLQENVQVLEKMMSHLGIDYKIIYLSEAWERLFKNSEYSNAFQKVLANIKIEDLRKGFDIEYIPFSMISLSKINYIIADYLIAMHLPELYPELCSTQPTHYLTSERFTVFHKKIDEYLNTTLKKYEPPTPIFVKGVPVLVHPKEESIPSMEMSQGGILNIVNGYYQDKKINEIELHDLFTVLNKVMENNFYFKEEKLSLEKLKKKLKKASKKIIIEAVTLNLHQYFNKIQKIIQKESIKERVKSLFVADTKGFNKHIKPLNPLKLQILHNCDGTNTSLDVSRKTGLKLSTVSTYFNLLKNQSLITNERKPKRLVDNIVVNLKDMT